MKLSYLIFSVVLINCTIWMLGSVSGLYCFVATGVRLYNENGVFVCRDNSSEERRKMHYVFTCLFQVFHFNFTYASNGASNGAKKSLGKQLTLSLLGGGFWIAPDTNLH